ncbi:TetR/AcrR family transcriptional regulator [Parasphingorhabdus pacifica]
MSTTRKNNTAPGLRERKKRATRRALQEAAIDLFGERGPDSVTIDDICAAADVSPRTFFNYFGTKEEVLAPWDPETIEATPELIARRPDAEDTLSAVREVLSGMLDDATQNSTWHARNALLGEHPALLHRAVVSTHALERAVREGVALRTGARPENFHPRLVAATSMATLRVTMETAMETAETTAVPVLEDAFGRLADGLRDD